MQQSYLLFYSTGDRLPSCNTTTTAFNDYIMDNPFASPDSYNNRVDKQAKRAEWQANKRSYRSKINY